MKNRRKFIQEAATLTIGAMGFGKVGWTQPFTMRKTIPATGLQLFTLLMDMDNDPVGTLQKVANAGYKNVESAFSKLPGFYGKKPKEFRAFIHDLGMEWKSHHVTGTPMKMPPNMVIPKGPDGNPMSFPVMKNLRDNGQEMIDLVAEAGIPYIVCSSIDIESGDEIKKSAEILNRTGELAKKAGLKFAYHNHATEFDVTDGVVSYDYFTSQISPDILKLEIDLGWVFKAGKNPVEIFKKNKGRIPLLHVKDMTKEGAIVPFGEGSFNFNEAFNNIDIAGVEYFFLEQDFPQKPFEHIVTGFQNFEKFRKTIV